MNLWILHFIQNKQGVKIKKKDKICSNKSKKNNKEIRNSIKCSKIKASKIYYKDSEIMSKIQQNNPQKSSKAQNLSAAAQKVQTNHKPSPKNNPTTLKVQFSLKEIRKC